jgi:hypothetical protein
VIAPGIEPETFGQLKNGTVLTLEMDLVTFESDSFLQHSENGTTTFERGSFLQELENSTVLILAGDCMSQQLENETALSFDGELHYCK